MAHFAQLTPKYHVTQVIVINNDALNNLDFPQSESIGISLCRSLFGDTTNWVQTSYNASFRKNFAGIGSRYDSVLDAFIDPQPYPSWSLNTDTCKWEPPVPKPDDNKELYVWDETTKSWKPIGT